MYILERERVMTELTVQEMSMVDGGGFWHDVYVASCVALFVAAGAAIGTVPGAMVAGATAATVCN